MFGHGLPTPRPTPPTLTTLPTLRTTSPQPQTPQPPLAPRKNVTVTVDWTHIDITTDTSATVEVDVMPFLSRAEDRGGPFDAYYSALTNLGAANVRFSPWFPYPKVVVPELTPTDCTGERWHVLMLYVLSVVVQVLYLVLF